MSAVLKVIQTFDPPGVGARDLRECLLIQFERLGQQNTLEYRIVSEFMDALGKRRIPEIARGTGASVDEVQEALARIARLEPRPGRAYLPDNDQYILPEVFVRKSGDDFVVTTDNEHIPHLRISNTYKDLMAQGEKLGRGAELYPREDPRREVPDQEPASAAADHPEYRQGDCESPARVPGQRRCLPQTADHGAGGASRRRA